MPPPAPRLQIRLLGVFRVDIGDHPVPEQSWRLRRAQHLLKVLALAPGYRLHRDQVLDALWPDAEPDAAALSLRQALVAARRALATTTGGTFPALHMVDDHLVLRPPGDLWVDVIAFEVAAEAAQRSDDPTTCAAALVLYAGDLAPDDPYADWAVSRREALRQRRLDLLLEQARRLQARGEPAAAVAPLARLVELEPTDEEAQATLVRLYRALGRPREAVRQYERLRVALREQLDTDPDPTSQALYSQLLIDARAPTTASRPRAGGLPPHNLPAPVTSLIGRDGEQAELLAWVAATPTTVRLLTLTGAGGCGKTRFALAVATGAVASADLDGVWLVDLSSLADPTLVPATVGIVLGVYAGPVDDLAARLVAALRERAVLLVLDNCEHLLDACAALVATLLAACPRLRVLATSREALRLPGERAFRVPSLGLASLDDDDPARLSASPAVQLFVERARLTDPVFTLTPTTAPQVATICHHLDGMPLAIELAAPWVRVLALPELAARLSRSLALLGDDERRVAGRQRTLRATLDWSYALLAEAEQRLLCRLSVFAGSFSLAAAEAVGADPADEPADLLRRLARLVDLSLVVANLDGGRYRLLETVRLDAQERLTASDAAAISRRRHAAFYLAQVRAIRPIIWGSHPDRTGCLDDLFRDLDNLRAAWHWLDDAGARDDHLWLAGALPPFFLHRCTLGEGLDWVDRALARPGADTSPSRAHAWLGQAYFARAAEDYDRALALAGASLPEFDHQGDAHGHALALISIGSIYAWQGDRARAQPVLEEALAFCRRLEPSPGVGLPLLHLGTLALVGGEWAEARVLLVEAIDTLEQAGDRFRAAHARLFDGLAALQLGDLAAARRGFAAGLADTAGTGDDWGFAIALELFGCLAVAQGQHEIGLRLAGAAAAVRAADSINISIIAYREWRDVLLQPAHVALPPDARAAALAAGRALDRDAAIAEAERVP